MSRYGRYNSEGIALARVEDAYSRRRHFNSLVRLLQELGRYCFKRRNDGVFDIGILRLLPLASHPRTILYSHFPALVACGALESCGASRYRIVGFLEHNPSGRQMHELTLQRREDMMEAKRRERERRRAFTECTRSVKAQPVENNDLVQNFGFLSCCHPQPTEPTPLEADISATNPSKDLPSRPLPDLPRTLGTTLASAFERAQRSAAKRRDIAAISDEEITAVEHELAADASHSRAAQISEKSTKYPTRVARKPRARRCITEADMEAALCGLQIQMSPPAAAAWWCDMRNAGVSAEDLEYAVWSVKRQRKNQRRIRDPLAYAKKIVLGQAQASEKTYLYGSGALTAPLST